MAFKNLISTAILLATVTNAAVLSNRQITTSSTTFRLAANVTNQLDFPFSVQGYELTYAPGAECGYDLRFTQPGLGSVFYQTTAPNVNITGLVDPNTNESVTGGIVVTPGGTATIPSLASVELDCKLQPGHHRCFGWPGTSL